MCGWLKRREEGIGGERGGMWTVGRAALTRYAGAVV